MSATELDLPVLMSAEQIRRREFVTIRRGYDPDQVRDYLEQLADQVELMTSMLREARMDAEAALRAGAQPRTDPYEQLARRMVSVIREADDAAERIRSEAHTDANRTIGEAQAEADRLRTGAQQEAEEARDEAERAVRDAREQADRTIAGLSTRREALVNQLAQMQQRLLGVARDLEAAIEIPADAAASDSNGDGPASTDHGASEAPSSVRIVDVTGGDAANGAGAEAVAEDGFAGLDDPSYEELWDGTEAINLEVPDIPPLDLSWGGDEDESPTQ